VPSNTEIILSIREHKKAHSLLKLKEIIPYTTNSDSQIKEVAVDVATYIIKASLFESYHEMDPQIRLSLANLLIKINPDVITAMHEEVYSNDIFMRVRAIQILGLVGKKSAVEQHLMQMIRDSDEKIRATVIRTLGELIDKSEANILLTLLNDFDERVRANTIEALEHLGNKNLTGILIRYRSDSNNRIRANALKALWNLGHKEIIPFLQEMLENPEENMRASGAWLIGELGKKDAEFIKYIKNIKYSDSILVRNNVIRALLKMDLSVSQIYLNSLFDESEIKEVKELYRIK
jgi:HEAT repeat protein